MASSDQQPYFIKTHLLRSSIKTKTRRSESSQFVVVENYTNVDNRLITKLYILNSKLGPAVSSSSSSPRILLNTEQIIELPDYRLTRCSPQTCHGLFTFTAYPATITSDSPTSYRIMVMNPATRELHMLPRFSEIDLLGSSYVLFDPSSCSYKVLWISRRHGTHSSLHFCVINLGGGDVSWRKVIVPDDLGMNDCWVFPDSVNGISYHFPSPYRYHPCRLDQISLLIFDAEKENFLVFNFLGVDGLTDIWSAGSAALRGSIYAFFICKNTPKVLDVWVMKDCMVNNMWIKENSCDSTLYRLDFLWGIHIIAVTTNGFVMKIFGRLKNGKPLMACAIYDPVRKVLRKYPIADEILKICGESKYPICGDYVESLVSPKHGY